MLKSFRSIYPTRDTENLGRHHGIQNCRSRIRRRWHLPPHPVCEGARLQDAQSSCLPKGACRKSRDHVPEVLHGDMGVSLPKSPDFRAKVESEVVRAGGAVRSQDHGDGVTAELFQGKRFPVKPAVGHGAVDHKTSTSSEIRHGIFRQPVPVGEERRGRDGRSPIGEMAWGPRVRQKISKRALAGAEKLLLLSRLRKMGGEGQTKLFRQASAFAVKIS